jgi:hypothetical protein
MASVLPINYQKSIAKERLIYKTNTSLIFTYLFSGFNAFVILAVLTMPVFVGFSDTLTWLQPFYIIFIIVFYCWAIANVVLLNSFVKIKGIHPEDNRKDIIEALSKYFVLENLDGTSAGIIRDIRLPWAFRNGRAVTCLLDEDMIYLNSVRLMRAASISVYSAVFMYYKCKRVAKQFQKLQAAKVTSINN